MKWSVRSNNMTIFVEKVLVQLSTNAVDQIYSHESLSLLAAVLSQPSGQILAFQNGKSVDDGPWSCPSKPMALTWHPTRAETIVGLKSGEIYSIMWNERKKTIKLPTTHESPVLFLIWPTENELISLDSMGVLSIWNGSKIGSYQLSVEHLLKDIPSQLVHCPSAMSWSCFVGCTSGIIYQVLQGSPVCSEVAHLDDPIQRMIHESNAFCVLTNGATLSVFERKDEGKKLELLNTVKMSGKSRSIQISWLGQRFLAITGGDLIIRIWNCESNETWALPLPQDSFHSGAEQFTSLIYHQQFLITGTNLGSVCVWRQQQSVIANPEDDWQFVGLLGLTGGPISQSVWCQEALCIHNGSTIFMIEQQQPHVVYRNQTGAVQISSSVINVHRGRNNWPIDSAFTVLGIDIHESHLLVHSDAQISIYQLGNGLSNEKPVLIGQFECKSLSAKLHKACCFCLESAVIQMRTFQGSLLSTLSFTDSEGWPKFLDISGNFLCAASSTGFVKIWDISSRLNAPYVISEPKLHVSTKHVISSIKNRFSGFHRLKSNGDGSCVAFTLRVESGEPNRLLIWRTTANAIGEFDFGQDFDADQSIGDFYWDEGEPRIVLCQLIGSKPSTLVSLFVPEDWTQEILIQDQVEIGDDLSLVGVRIPRFILLDASAKFHVRRFESLVLLEEHDDKATRDALLTFGCHLRRGRVEQAYQVVRSLTSASVWESLARSCVRLQRPDVGLICLGKLGNARAAQAVRIAQKKYPKQIEAVTAVLAVQLAMNDEAEELCQQIGCYELLSKMYQASNQWDKALQLAQTKDRLNLKRTYYDYAHHLENEGKFQEAKVMYEKCQTHHFDVPRMLYDNLAALEEYCTTSNDPELLRWWAQYLESSGEMDAALDTYKKAGDYLSLVRLHCYLGDLAQATELAERSRNQAACFHVARQHEADNNIPEALNFFAQAGAFGNAVRLCKEHELEDQLYRYALQGDHEELIEAARYFETVPLGSDRQPRYDRAVLLYSKAGLLDTALDLASRTDQHEAVLELSRRLDSNSNPISMQRCADYLAAHKHYDAAVDLLAMAGRVTDAIDMCLQFNLKLTESLADKLTATENNQRLLIQLAEAAQRQGDYQLAAKKFTQAGDKLQAMKALLKSGDTDRIVFFANVSRQREIYILAGNYLQTLDWRSHPEYVRHIVNYYMKARAPELLAGFYEACAQAEIDEYQNYANAVNALKEAINAVSKSESQHDVKKNLLQQKLDFVKLFIEKQELGTSNPAEVKQLEALLNSPALSLGIINSGNIYSSIFNIHFKHKAYKEAVEVLTRMKTDVPHFTRYLEQETVLLVCQAQNISPELFKQLEVPEVEEQSDEIKEFIRNRFI